MSNTLTLEERLFEKTADERSRGRLSIEGIRNQFIDEDRKFQDQSMTRDRIVDYSFFVVHSAFMARTFLDDATVEFMYNDVWPQKDVVKNLNLTYKTDFKNEEWYRIRYQKDYDKYKYGVGIVARIGWDGYEKKNCWQVVDPRLVVPDPNGNYITDEYEFIGFETEKRKFELPDTYNQAVVDRMEPWNTYLTQKKKLTQTNDGYFVQFDSHYYVIYHHFTYLDKKLYYTVWSLDGGELGDLLFMEEVKGQLPQDEGCPKIRHIVSCDRWRPKADNFFGHRLAVFCVNVQEQKSLIATLRFSKSKAELYPMYIANSRMIKDRTDLDFWFNKIIFANPLEWEDIGNVMKPIQKDFRADNSFLIDNDLENQLTRVTGGMNGNQINGQETTRRETLGAIQNQQSNADINLGLTEKVSTWFETNIAWSWLTGYLTHFKAGDVKITEIDPWLWPERIALKKDDFLAVIKLTVFVSSALEEEKSRMEDITTWTNFYNLSTTIQAPIASRKYMLRKIGEKSKFKPTELEMMVVRDPQEEQALIENAMLYGDMFTPIAPTDDDLTHIITHRVSGIQNDVMGLHIAAHIQAYIKKGGNPAGVDQANENAKNLQQSMMWQNISQMQGVSNGQKGWML